MLKEKYSSVLKQCVRNRPNNELQVMIVVRFGEERMVLGRKN